MSKQEIDQEIRKTLKDIFEYLGVTENVDDCALITYLERLIEKVTQ